MQAFHAPYHSPYELTIRAERDMCFTRDGTHLVSTWGSAWVNVRNLATNRFSKHSLQISPSILATSSTGGRVVVGGLQGDVAIIDMETNSVVARKGHPEKIFGRNNAGFVTMSMALDRNGKLLATAGHEKIAIWQMDVDAPPRIISIKAAVSSLIWRLAFSPDSTHLASVDDEGEVKLWSVVRPHGDLDDQPIWTGQRHVDRATDVAYSPDGTWLVSVSRDRTGIVWNAGDGSVHCELPDNEYGLFSVAISPDGKWIATGARDGEVRLLDAATRCQVTSHHHHTGLVSRLAFSPDGKPLASMSADRRILLWPYQQDLATAE
jgi:WD40 repeat protein